MSATKLNAKSSGKNQLESSLKKSKILHSHENHLTPSRRDWRPRLWARIKPLPYVDSKLRKKSLEYNQ